MGDETWASRNCSTVLRSSSLPTNLCGSDERRNRAFALTISEGTSGDLFGLSFDCLAASLLGDSLRELFVPVAFAELFETELQFAAGLEFSASESELYSVYLGRLARRFEPIKYEGIITEPCVHCTWTSRSLY